MSSLKRVMVCQNRTCRQQGASKVLAALQAHPVAGISVISCGCLGQCGNGPMVLIFPEEVWYSRVHPEEVPLVIEQHLLGDKPVAGMLYQKFHQRS